MLFRDGDETGGGLAARLHARAEQLRIPLSGTFEVTRQCNLGCVHCYIREDADPPTCPDSRLTLDEVRGIIDEAARMGCLYLAFSGGEPLVRPDIVDILAHARSRGILPLLLTNATLVGPEHAGAMAGIGMLLVEVSLYGATERTHDAITRVPGSHERCMRGIELLREAGVPLRLKAPLLVPNLQEIQKMRGIADGMGVGFRFDPLITPTLRGDRAPLEMRVPPGQVLELEQSTPGFLDALQGLCGDASAQDDESSGPYRCNGGASSFHVDASGRLSACIMCRDPSGTIREGGFEDVWNGIVPRLSDREWTTDSACRTCHLSRICGRCPGWVEQECGDEEAVVEYLCRLAAGRSKAIEGRRGKLS